MTRLGELKRVIELAGDRKAKSPCTIAVVLAHYEYLRSSSALEICRELGLSDSYQHQIRALMQVPEELEALGFRLTNS